ncbi:MAG: bifunctional metallophosphatase/5'-nucleotidase [Elusimicrobia bacterium]|nr:bifunctional metallophosphatase/5'-nucleotidase [Elusimicrobiota bacterium]
MKNLLLAIIAPAVFAFNLSAKTILIYHTSDVHGWYSSKEAAWDKENPKRKIGGFAALASLLKKEKNPYVLLDSGDTYQGTPEGNFTKGMATIMLMNQLGYAACAAGNHEYDYGEENFKNLASSATFPFLGANVYYKETAKPVEYLKPYTIVEKNGKKIGVIGLAGKHTSITTLPSNVKHLEFRDETAQSYVWTQEIKKQNPDVIVILLHEGTDPSISLQKADMTSWTPDKKQASFGTIAVARSSKGADVVLGGHLHTGIFNGYFDKESSTLISESFWGLTDVTRIDLEFDDATGKFKSASAKLIPLWIDETGEDEKILETIESFSAVVNKEMDRVIGKTEIEINETLPGSGKFDSPIGNWFCDILRKHAKTDIAVQNTGGIRSYLKKGDIRIRDIYHIMPFENTLVTFKITGRQLENMMRENLRPERSKMQVSGIKVRFRMSSERKPVEIYIERNGKKVNPEDEFTIATNNYLTSGGFGEKFISEIKEIADTMIPIRDALIKGVAEARTISKQPDSGRIIKLE